MNETIDPLTHHLIEIFPEEIIVFNGSGIVIGASELFCRYFDLSNTEIAGMSLLGLLSSKWDYAQVKALIKTHQSTDEPVLISANDGKQIEVSCYPIDADRHFLLRFKSVRIGDAIDSAPIGSGKIQNCGFLPTKANPARLMLVYGSGDPAVNSHTIEWVNSEWTHTFGWTLEELQDQQSLAYVCADIASYQEILRFATDHSSHWHDFQIRAKDGQVIDTSWTKIGFSNNHILYVGENITQYNLFQKHSDTLAFQQEAITILSQHALETLDLKQLMQEAVFLIATFLNVSHVKILELLPNSDTLLLQAAIGWKSEYIGKTTLRASSDSQAGYTLRVGRPVVMNDLATETRFSGSFLLHEHSIVSGVSVVIIGNDQPYGVLTAHTVERRNFSREDIYFIQAVANVLAVIIERERADRALRESKTRYHTLSELTSDYAYAFRVEEDGRLIREWVTDAIARITDFSLDEIDQQGGWTSLVYPPDFPIAEKRARTLLAGHSDVSELRIITRSNDTRWVRDYAYAVWDDAKNRVIRIVGAVQDITEKKRFEEKQSALLMETQALSRRLIEVDEFNRRRLAIELHDCVGQNLTALKMNLTLMRNRLHQKVGLGDVLPRLREAHQLVEQTIEQVRDLMYELRPVMLDDYGLESALHAFIQQLTERTGITVALAVTSAVPLQSILSSDVQLTLYRVTQEALTNVTKHANATHVDINLNVLPNEIALHIIDNGVGFNLQSSQTQQSKPEQSTKPSGLGIIGMRERIETIGGKFSVHSVLGEGTQVQVYLPL